MSTDKQESEFTIVERTGEPPLRFKSTNEWKESSRTVSGSNSKRWTTVHIYKTAGGKYVARVSSITCWEGEHDFHKAQSCATPAEVIEYLKHDEGNLGRVSQGAIEAACKEDPEFAKAFVEEVD